MTVYVTIDEVYEIHEYMLKKSGGRGGVRDFSLLHSAVERPKATFGGEDLYPSLFSKAAALLHSLCMNHAFFDGNKRTAFLSMKRFLKLNGYQLISYKKQAADFMVLIDNDKPEFEEILRWLKDHSQKLSAK